MLNTVSSCEMVAMSRIHITVIMFNVQRACVGVRIAYEIFAGRFACEKIKCPERVWECRNILCKIRIAGSSDGRLIFRLPALLLSAGCSATQAKQYVIGMKATFRNFFAMNFTLLLLQEVTVRSFALILFRLSEKQIDFRKKYTESGLV